MLTIEHTSAEGTLLSGTARGDGSAEVVKALRWRWSRSLGCWFVPRSRDVPAKRDLIERTAQELRAAGFEVEVSIDASTPDMRAREERLQEQSHERVQRLTARAEREEQRSQASYERARQVGDGIPFGQPILVGHHSQRRAERDAERIHRAMGASVEHGARAATARGAAKVAAASTGARHSPVTVGNRIERLGAEARRLERAVAAVERAIARGASVREGRLQQLREELEHTRADLDYWQQVRDEQLRDGTAAAVGPETVRVGDVVKVSGGWRRVVRVNAKSVTLATDCGQGRVPWHRVTGHRRVEQESA